MTSLQEALARLRHLHGYEERHQHQTLRIV